MSFPRSFALLAVALIATLAGCKINTINNFPTRPASVRFIGFIPDAPALNVDSGGSTVWSSVPFITPTDYVQFDNRQTSFDVLLPDQPDAIAGASASLSGYTSYTVLAYGMSDQANAAVQTDSFVALNPGNAQYRLTHMATGAGGFGVYITTPDFDITDYDAQFGIALASTTAFQRIDSGPQRIRLTRGGSTTLVFDSGALDFPDQSTFAYYLYVQDGTHAINMMRVDMTSGTTSLVPNTVAAVKVVNGAYQAGSVDALWDGTIGISDVDYPSAATTYFSLPAGTHTMSFQSHDTPGAIIASAQKSFSVSTDSTLLISGPNGSQTLTVLPDHNLPPPKNMASVRFVNGSPDIAVFDLYVDDELKASGIGYTQASAYFVLTPTNHKLEFRMPGTATAYLTVDSQQFAGGEVTSYYVVGPASDLKSFATRDNT